jgi:hypothetical protein
VCGGWWKLAEVHAGPCESIFGRGVVHVTGWASPVPVLDVTITYQQTISG